MTTTRWLRLALLGGAAATILSCAEPTPLEVRGRFAAPQPGLIGDLAQRVGLLACTPLGYDSVTQTIGPGGGTLYVGPHALRVPAGALADTVSITAVAPSDTVNRVQLRPEGLTFLSPASLTMAYGNCNLLGAPLPPRIAYTTDALLILEYLQSVSNPIAQRVTGRLEHFSNYAVAW
jgi:hypothetical protein